jgi:type I restriction enzyme S subunit
MRKGWTLTTFENITRSLKRGPFGGDLKKSFFVKTGYKVYEQQHAIKNDFTLGTYFIDGKRYQNLKACEVGPGDYIVSCSGTMGRIARLPQDAPHGIINQALLRIRINDKIIDHKYFTEFFRSRLFQSKILKDSRGSGMQNMAGIKEIKPIALSLPPLPEQRAIVAKIEQLFSELDNGIANLKKAQEQLKIYRQAVLKKAFEGELTNEILNGRKLPEGWKWVKFGEMFSIKPQNGLYKPASEYGSGTKILRIDGFYDGVIISDYQFQRVKLDQSEIEKYSLSVGDIVINRVNSMSHLGKCGLVKKLEDDTVFESNIMKVKINSDLALPGYINHYLASKVGISELVKNAKQAVNQASINQQDVSNVKIPLCSKTEQSIIIQEIETRLSICDKLEEDIRENLKKSEALRQSILKQAFEGKLLSQAELDACRQEPDWEPAEKLLERIKQEKKK